MTLPTTSQFRSATTQSGKKALEAYTAAWDTGRGEEVFIGAPSLAALKAAWERIVACDLNVEGVQHVWIVSADSGMKDAPDVKPTAATVPCKFCGCAASFIIHRIAVCERRECKEKADGM